MIPNTAARTLPVNMQMINGEVYAIFPTLPTDSGINLVVFSVAKGRHEIRQSELHGSDKVPFEFRQQLQIVLRNLGYNNMKYYSNIRPWMHRDRRMAEERNRYIKRTTQRS